MQSFQFRIIHRIIPCNQCLKNLMIKKVSNVITVVSLCPNDFCVLNPGTENLMKYPPRDGIWFDKSQLTHSGIPHGQNKSYMEDHNPFLKSCILKIRQLSIVYDIKTYVLRPDHTYLK